MPERPFLPRMKPPVNSMRFNTDNDEVDPSWGAAMEDADEGFVSSLNTRPAAWLLLGVIAVVISVSFAGCVYQLVAN